MKDPKRLAREASLDKKAGAAFQASCLMRKLTRTSCQ